MEGRNRAPWLQDPNAWGRVRLTKDMAAANVKALNAYLHALRSYHKSMDKPSEESLAAMREIRMVEKILENLEGLRREKGWATPPTSSPPGS